MGRDEELWQRVVEQREMIDGEIEKGERFFMSRDESEVAHLGCLDIMYNLRIGNIIFHLYRLLN